MDNIEKEEIEHCKQDIRHLIAGMEVKIAHKFVIKQMFDLESAQWRLKAKLMAYNEVFGEIKEDQTNDNGN